MAVAEEPITGLASIKGLKAYCGIAIQLQRVDWVKDYEKTIDDAANDGADTVSLVVDARQENSLSTFIYMDVRKTMTNIQLTEIIRYAKAKHLHVILMPIVLLDDADDPHWRGTLDPHAQFPGGKENKPTEAWHEWFENYRSLITYYAQIAQETGVDVLVVGSELVSSESHADEWIETIKAVRAIYKGQLTYSSNWDRFRKVPFWKYLDFVGMNSYWTLGMDANVPMDTVMYNWRDIQRDMFKFLDEVHKPVVLLEAGWCSLSNAAKDPWDYTQTQLDADNDLQQRLYEGFFKSWWGNPHLGGFAVWEMRPGGDQTGKGYSPQGKPAEQTMRDWFAKPRWDVNTN